MGVSCILISSLLFFDAIAYVALIIINFNLEESVSFMQGLIQGGNYLQVFLIFIWGSFFIGSFLVLCSISIGFFSNIFLRNNLITELQDEITTDPNDIAIVIPVYNEEDTIEQVISGCRQFSNHIVVINDGSTDNTSKILSKTADIHLLTHRRNQGLGKTMKRGIEYAKNLDIKAIITFDADGQYRASEIPKIAYPVINNEADLVLGSRFAGKIENMSLNKRIGNKLMSFSLSLLLGLRISDSQTGFRGISNDLANTYRLRGEYTYTQETIIQARFFKRKIIELPIFFDKRISGSSRLINSPIDYAWRSWLTILRTLRDFQPIWFFGGFGVILFFLGLFFFSFSAISVIMIPIPFDLAILSTILLLVGIQFIFFGFLADAQRPIE